MLEMNTIELVFIVFSLWSCICSAAVLLTVVMFPQMRKRGFTQIIIFISFSEFVAAVASAFGFPLEKSMLCPVQSFLFMFAYKCSWAWTAALCHQLYHVVTTGNYGLSLRSMHLICWLVPLASTLIPLSTSEYGRDDDSSEPLAWCFLEGKELPIILWVIFSFYLVFFGCLFVMLYYLFKLYWQFRGIDLKTKHLDIYQTLDALRLYPLGLIVAWVPNICFSIISNSQHNNSDGFADMFNLVTLLATQAGTITSIIFFLKSQEARYRWKMLLWGAGECTENEASQFENDDFYDNMTESTRGSLRLQETENKIYITSMNSNISINRANTLSSSGTSRLDSSARAESNSSDLSEGIPIGNGPNTGWSKFPKTGDQSLEDGLSTSVSSLNSTFSR